MMKQAMRAAIKPYSIAVTPRASRAKDKRRLEKYLRIIFIIHNPLAIDVKEMEDTLKKDDLTLN